MRLSILFTTGFIFSSIFSFAQIECGTSDEEIMSLRKQLTSQFMKSGQTETIAVEIIAVFPNPNWVPTYTTSEALKAQVESLDTTFNKIGIEFEVCSDVVWYFNESYAGTYYYIHENKPYLMDRFKTPGRLTVFVGLTAKAGATAYASIQENLIISTALAMNGGTVLIHEVGHMLGLPHTHSQINEKELVDGSNCAIAGDLFCDTPADPKLSGRVNSDCEYTGTSIDANGDAYDPLVNNHMSYSKGYCRYDFTPEQEIVMQDMMALKKQQGHYLPCNTQKEYCIQKMTITDCQGIISDGSGSANYNNDSYCEFLLTSELPNAQIELSFDMFATEENVDILKIYDGENASAQLILTHSGNTIPSNIKASGANLFLVFETNGTSTANGWVANYDCFEGSDLEVILPYNDFYTIDGSDLLIHAHTVNHGNKPNIECQSQLRLYHGSAPMNGADTNIYTTTPVITPGDTVIVTTKFEICLLEIKTNSNGLYHLNYNVDIFNSNQEYNRINNFNFGNRINIDPICSECTPASASNKCIDSISDGSGDFMQYEGNLNCSWNITSSAGSGLKIYFDYTDINAYRSYSKDSLVVYDGIDENSPVLAVIKEHDFIDTLYTAGNDAFIQFVTDDEYHDNGWKLKYECINPTGLSELQKPILKVWPNPSTSGVFNLDYSGVEELVLYNQIGQRITIVAPNSQQIILPTQGIYFLRSQHVQIKLVH
jgi:hypothetical protein